MTTIFPAEASGVIDPPRDVRPALSERFALLRCRQRSPLRFAPALNLSYRCRHENKTRPGGSLLERLPHVDDGGLVRGRWRALRRDCLHCRPHCFPLFFAAICSL
jgi:hypothetical protein